MKIEKIQALGMGKTVIKGVGHHVCDGLAFSMCICALMHTQAPHENPQATGEVIFDILCKAPMAPVARL